MGSTTISYAVVALAVALVGLLAGFFWGRSNLKSKVEQAVEEGAAALDAREFTMRRQLDQAIDEIARLRPLAEELGRVQDRLKLEQSKYARMKSEFDDTVAAGNANPAEQEELQAPFPEPEPVPESADEAVQRLLKSLEVTMSESVEEPPPPPKQPDPVPVPASVAVQAPPAPPQPPPAPPQAPPATPGEVSVTREQRPMPRPAVSMGERQKKQPEVSRPVERKAEPAVDEWQEFARSLADLTKRNQ